MKDSTALESGLGGLLRTSKLAILLEISVVFVPMYALLMVGDRLGNDFVPLGGNVVLVGGPLGYLGMILSLAVVWVSARIRGVGWREFGLARPKSWVRTILIGVSVTVAFIVAGTVLNQLSLTKICGSSHAQAA